MKIKMITSDLEGTSHCILTWHVQKDRRRERWTTLTVAVTLPHLLSSLCSSLFLKTCDMLLMYINYIS